MLVPIVLFGCAALAGLTLAMLRLRERALPMAVALVHGGLAATGLAWLIVVVLTQGAPLAVWVALVLFIAAALGGFLSYSYHLRDLMLPKPLLFVHAGAAVVAYLLLLYGALA